MTHLQNTHRGTAISFIDTEIKQRILHYSCFYLWLAKPHHVQVRQHNMDNANTTVIFRHDYTVRVTRYDTETTCSSKL